MKTQSLSTDQSDTLQEIVNIAMGQAGDSLARVLIVSYGYRYRESNSSKSRISGNASPHW
jgi:hypothetical protein